MNEKPETESQNNPIDPMTMTLVNGWLEDEREAGSLDGLDESQLVDIALDRVRMVIGGEVRWSEATPGDKAIWRGRARDVTRFDRRWRAHEGHHDPLGDGARTGGIAGRRDQRQVERAERRFHVFWDTTAVNEDGFYSPWQGPESPGMNSLRLFGNANVGNLRLTNMQVAGQMPGDQSFYVAEMYATATDFDGLVAIADRAFATFIMGMQPQTQVALRELVHGVPVRLVIPTRQNFSVLLDLFTSPVIKRRFDPFELSIHLEGILQRPVY